MLELEQSLVREREKLAGLRKQHYHMASLVAADGVDKKVFGSETRKNFFLLVFGFKKRRHCIICIYSYSCLDS